MTLTFTGQKIIGLDIEIPVTSVVRDRGPNEVLKEKNGRISKAADARAYKPRPFPLGHWQITKIAWQDEDSIYWPVFIRTNAWQWLSYWTLNRKGEYKEQMDMSFKGYGYGLHHARFCVGDELVRSNTTLGCQNIIVPSDADYLACTIDKILDSGEQVFIDVPPWRDWK